MTAVSTEQTGHYTEIYVDGFPDGSLAYDAKENEVIIAADNFRIDEQPDGTINLVAEMKDNE